MTTSLLQDSMFDPICIGLDDTLYPPALRCHLGDQAPAAITARGNLDILSNKAHTPTVALFCSVQCSSAIILQTYALARALRDAGVTWWLEARLPWVSPLAEVRERIRKGPPRV